MTQSHALVAPFEATGRMPYVAHTKLCEYIEWARPVIAPNLPVVKEHFPQDKGIVYFQAGNPLSLKDAILKTQENLPTLQKQILTLGNRYTWEKRAEIYIKVLNTKDI